MSQMVKKREAVEKKIRKLLLMTDCPSVRDVSFEGSKVRNALCEKLWLEKETGLVS